jgi:signal transduction histidine kinase
MNFVVSQLENLTPATGIVIELAEENDMVYKAATGSIGEYIGLRLPISNSISGLCVTTQKILCSEDTEKDSRVNREACRKVGARSLVVAPLFYHDKAVGVLKIISNKPSQFNDTDIITLQLMSGLIASGIAQNIFIIESKKVEEQQNEFISMVSHELRTPLTSISGSLVLLLSGILGNFSDEVKSLIEIANNNSDRLIRLVNDILDVQKLNANKMNFNFKLIVLSEILKEAVAVNQMYANQLNVTLTSEIEENDIIVKIDTDRFLQIMANLISNAIKFSSTGGCVLVRSTTNIKIVRIEVIDHGTGIPEEFQSRIFQQFAQAETNDRKKHGGTGLGLNITKMIIEKFGGKIDFKSSPLGTTFYFELPIYQKNQ